MMAEVPAFEYTPELARYDFRFSLKAKLYSFLTKPLPTATLPHTATERLRTIWESTRNRGSERIRDCQWYSGASTSSRKWRRRHTD